jgi:hypothetical protein
MLNRRRRGLFLAGSAVLAAVIGMSSAVLTGAIAPAAAVGQQPQAKPAQKAGTKGPAAKLAEPWPDAATSEAQRARAEGRPLFASAEPLALTLTADFEAINKIRDPDSTKRVPGTLEVPGEGGKMVSFPVQLGSRGHLRLNPRTCSTVPLRVEFAKADIKGSVFDGPRELKLVTHCQNDKDSEQNVLAEYLAYRVFNLFTPRSYRARLVKATYVDASKKKAPVTKFGMFIEDDDDVAKRTAGRVIPLANAMFRQLDQESLVAMSLVQFLIGNTDYSITTLHNIRLVQDRQGAFRPVTYDFDLSGLVNARYALPARGLGIATVRDRYYRGPCLAVDALEPYLAPFRAKQAETLALVDAIPAFETSRRQDARDFLGEFFSIVNSKGRTKTLLVDRCPKVAGM